MIELWRHGPKHWLSGCINMSDGTNTDCRLQMPQGTHVCLSPSKISESITCTLPERQWIQWSPLSPSLFCQTLTPFSAVNKHSLLHRRMVFHFTTFYFPSVSLNPIIFYLFSLDLVYFRFWSMRWVTTLYVSESDPSKDFTAHLTHDSSN